MAGDVLAGFIAGIGMTIGVFGRVAGREAANMRN